MAASSKRIAGHEADPIQPVRSRTGFRLPFGSISGGPPRSIPLMARGSISHGSISSGECRCKFFPAKHPLPVGLRFQLDPPVEGGASAARDQVNRPTLLIHAQDPSFGCCWFSRPVDFGESSGNPAIWMLQKTAMDTWFLCLRRVSGEVAAYHLKTKKHSFPIKLKKGHVSKEFKKWPPTITIIWAE